MSSSIRQGFTFPRSDIQRAKTAAATSGMSMNEWMRRTVRAALDGPTPTAKASVGALDTSSLDAIAQRLGEQINDLSRVGGGLRKIEDRLARGQPLPLAARTATAPSTATGARSA